MHVLPLKRESDVIKICLTFYYLTDSWLKIMFYAEWQLFHNPTIEQSYDFWSSIKVYSSISLIVIMHEFCLRTEPAASYLTVLLLLQNLNELLLSY